MEMIFFVRLEMILIEVGSGLQFGVVSSIWNNFNIIKIIITIKTSIVIKIIIIRIIIIITILIRICNNNNNNNFLN